MKQLKTIRIFLAVLFMVATAAYLLIGPQVHPMAVVSEKVQIIPSAIAVTIGATLVWLVITFLFGRIYCSTVCPVGTLQDIAIRMRRWIPRLNHPFRYRSDRPWRYHVLIIYLLCLATGIMIVPWLIEPWNIARSAAAAVNPDTVRTTWLTLGIGAGTGALAGITSLILIFIASLFMGREFCNTICPVGSVMSLLSDQSLYHIEIDSDKCVSCLKCEDVCKSSCIKVVSRYVDNGRCVRCFDCMEVCPEDAIRLQFNRNRPATPLMRRKKVT